MGGANDLPRLRMRVSRGFIIRAGRNAHRGSTIPRFNRTVFSQMKGNEATFAMSGRPGRHSAEASGGHSSGRFCKQSNHTTAIVQDEVRWKKKSALTSQRSTEMLGTCSKTFLQWTNTIYMQKLFEWRTSVGGNLSHDCRFNFGNSEIRFGAR